MGASKGGGHPTAVLGQPISSNDDRPAWIGGAWNGHPEAKLCRKIHEISQGE